MIDLKIKKTKYIVVVSSTVLILLIVILIALMGRATLIIKTQPANAIVRVNNAPLELNSQGEKKIFVKPGLTTITVEADGYISSKKNVNLKKAGTLKYEVSLMPDPLPIALNEDQNINIDVQALTLANEENTILYLGDNSTALYKAEVKIDENGIVKTVYNYKISNPSLQGIQKVIWSPKKDSAIFKKNNGAFFFDFKKYNLVSQEEVKYGEYIGDIAWSPDDSKIAYYYAPPSGEKSLIFANKSNTEMTRVANFVEMGIDNPYLAWSPNSEWLIVIPRNRELDSNKIYLFNAYTRTFTTVSDSGYNVEAVFNKKGDKILYSSYSPEKDNPDKFILSEMELNGENKRSLDIRTLTNKFAFTNNEDRNIIVSTYNKAKKVEVIFPFNLDDKNDGAFKIYLPPNTTINGLVLSNNDDIIFYLAGNRLYAASLTKVK